MVSSLAHIAFSYAQPHLLHRALLPRLLPFALPTTQTSTIQWAPEVPFSVCIYLCLCVCRQNGFDLSSLSSSSLLPTYPLHLTSLPPSPPRCFHHPISSHPPPTPETERPGRLDALTPISYSLGVCE
nr:hypothetical protein HmN_000187600 [Hymenolepis microstoma]